MMPAVREPDTPVDDAPGREFYNRLRSRRNGSLRREAVAAFTKVIRGKRQAHKLDISFG